MNTDTSKGLDPKTLFFRNYISELEWSKGKLKDEKENGGEKDLENLTKEFRVKYSYLCEDVLAFLRGSYLPNYRGLSLVL